VLLLTQQPGPSFRPSDYGNVLLWYAPEGLSGIPDGAPISLWPAAAGPGQLAPSDPENLPTKHTRTQSGLPYCRCTWPQGLQSPYLYSAVRHGTIAAVLKPAAVPSDNSINVVRFGYPPLDARFDYSHIDDAHELIWGHFDGEGGPDSSALCDEDTWYVCIGRADPSNPRFLLNNAVKTPLWSGGTNPGTTLSALSLDPPIEGFANEVSEFVYFNELLSNEKMLQLAEALMQRHVIEPFPP
jgi:hypothetical protein